MYVNGPATETRVEVARAHFIEMRERGFSVEGGIDRHKSDPDTTYEVVRFDPLLGKDAKSSGVSCFVVSGDRLLFLRRTGWQPLPREPEVLGEIGSRVVGGSTQPRPGVIADFRAPSDGEGLVPGGIAHEDGERVKPRRRWWDTHPRDLWAWDDWVAYYVAKGSMTPNERNRMKIAGTNEKPVELMTPGERRWLGVPDKYPQS